MRFVKMRVLWLILAFVHEATLLDTSSACGQAMQGRCICGMAMYEGTLQYVVNCTDTKFNDTSPLQHLPTDTEVLIFTGNYITELPWNVFGTLNSYLKLRLVDMSNNNIQKILGKSYHRVANVQRLILNHNRISISDEDHHPRIFSNFVNLQELHLTNAFQDNAENLGIDLHDVFVNSNLTNLLKLHLEQNEVKFFKDREVFCDLPRLMDLHLGNNDLKGLDFRIDCLHHLRYIDLEGNNITKFRKSDYAALDALPARNQPIEVNISDNPYSCDCGIHQLFAWLASTKVRVRETYRLRCHRDDGELPPKHPVKCDDDAPIKMAFAEENSNAAVIIVTFLSIIVVILVLVLIYSHRKEIRHRLQPMVDTVSRKVYYSSISPSDDHEVEV